MSMYRFRLSPSFVEQYKNKKVNWSSLGEVVYYRTYSRFIEGENRKEQWWETVLRVVEGCFQVQKEHCNSLKLPWKNQKAQKSAAIMYDKVFNFKFTPPGRGLWLMGTKFVKERGGAALNSCAFSSTEDIDTRGSWAFSWAMDALMLGVGVGFDTKGEGKIIIQEPSKEQEIQYKIPDSREGWVYSMTLLLDGYFSGRGNPIFDYSQIRAFGEPLKGFGGIAGGFKLLKDLHDRVRDLLNKRVDQEITSVDIVDLMDMIGVCVVAGNIRRSAISAQGLESDTPFRQMKDPRYFKKELESHRWASNNSVLAEVGKTQYNDLVKNIEQNGEPGIIWLENMQKYGRMCDPPDWKDIKCLGSNPCMEMNLESGELCNVVESYPSHHQSYEEYEETLKYAYLYAKTVSLVPTHWPETNAILLKNRRIGLSQSGIIDAFVKHGRREMLNWSDKAYSYLKGLDRIYSDWLCIPRSLKISAVKPSGSVSILANVSPGIHYPHDRFYIRRIRVGIESPIVSICEKAGYPIEPSISDPEKTMVISFPIKEDYFDRGKKDVSIWEQLQNVADYQYYWADNSVSVTVTFTKNEAKDISRALEIFETKLKAVSFLPLVDHGYEQMPFESISEREYDRLVSELNPLDFKGIIMEPEGEKFCSSEQCEVLK